MTTEPKRITQQEAEECAKKAVGDYLNACQLVSEDQIADVLMKLCSVAGVLMAKAEGSYLAAMRLRGTAAFIERDMPAVPAKLERVQ